MRTIYLVVSNMYNDPYQFETLSEANWFKARLADPDLTFSVVIKRTQK